VTPSSASVLSQCIPPRPPARVEGRRPEHDPSIARAACPIRVPGRRSEVAPNTMLRSSPVQASATRERRGHQRDPWARRCGASGPAKCHPGRARDERQGLPPPGVGCPIRETPEGRAAPAHQRGADSGLATGCASSVRAHLQARRAPAAKRTFPSVFASRRASSGGATWLWPRRVLRRESDVFRPPVNEVMLMVASTSADSQRAVIEPARQSGSVGASDPTPASRYAVNAADLQHPRTASCRAHQQVVADRAHEQPHQNLCRKRPGVHV
jgi:hypothetical protein